MKRVLPAAGAVVDEAIPSRVTSGSPRRDEKLKARTPEGASVETAGAAPANALDVGHGAGPNWIDEVLAGSFPASDPPSWTPGVARPAPMTLLPGRRTGPLTFLVSYVPDEREMYGEALKIAGFDVRTFADPFNALDAAVSTQPGVVVTRILQPGFAVDGLELARRIRRHPRTHGAAVLVITSLNANTHRAAAVEAGCDRLLMLPCVPDELVHQIRQTVASRSRVERHAATARSRAAL